MRARLERRGGTSNDFVFPSRNGYMTHQGTSTIVSNGNDRRYEAHSSSVGDAKASGPGVRENLIARLTPR